MVFSSWLRYCTGVAQWRSTKRCTMFGRLLGWYGTLYVHFGGSWSLTEFCHVQNSLCVQVLHSPILAVLLHGTRAVGISKTLQHGIFTRQGSHPVRQWALELSSSMLLALRNITLRSENCFYFVEIWLLHNFCYYHSSCHNAKLFSDIASDGNMFETRISLRYVL